MSYTSINQKKEEFRKYLEKNGVVDSITKVLVSLYEEPERPSDPLDYIKKYLGASASADVQPTAATATTGEEAGGDGSTAQLREENELLQQRIKELEEKLNLVTMEEKGDDEQQQENAAE